MTDSTLTPGDAPVPSPPNRAENAAWFAPQLLVATVRVDFDPPSADGWAGVLELGDDKVRRDGRWLDCSTNVEGSSLRTWIGVLDISPDAPEGPLGGLSLDAGGTTRRLSPASLDSVLCSPAELASTWREEFDADTRARLQRFLAELTRSHVAADPRGFAANLAAVRDHVREPLPQTELAPGPYSARLEEVTALDEHGFWLTGWIHAAEPRRVRLAAVSPEGERVELPRGAITYHERPRYSSALKDDDTVSTLGFYAYAELSSPSRHPDGWLVEFTAAGGETVQDIVRDPVETATKELPDLLLKELRLPTQDPAVLEHQIVPAMSRLTEVGPVPRIERILEFGAVPSAPEVSVVIAARPFSRIEHQLVEFARDPEIGETELLFVTFGSGAAEIEELAEELHDLYGIPFRVALLSLVPRYPRALNLGASAARGRLLVLMRGDVLPAAPGWIARMQEFSDSAASIGVVGPKLLHEDGSIAHAGAEYVGREGHWQRRLPFAGLASNVAPATSARAVEAVSDICMMIEAEAFRSHGGFSELYLGNSADEAGDLCLRLADASRETWYLPSAELYVIDQRAQPAQASKVGSRFNDWLFEHRFGARLAARAPSDVLRTVSEGAPPPRLPMIPAFGSGRPGAAVEDLVLETAALDGSELHGAGVNLRGPYDRSYAFGIDGWALHREGTPLAIEVRSGGERVVKVETGLPRKDIAERYPDTPGADTPGYRLVIGSLGLAPEFTLEIAAVTEDGARTLLGTLRGRRRQLQSSYRPTLKPLLVTTIGRTGSSWMMALISTHPEIVACEPFTYEARFSSYWLEMLHALADPSSFMQAMLPDISGEDWWLGKRRRPVAPRALEPAMPQWLGSENVEVMAGFCQSRLDGFYQETARRDGLAAPRYFAEKLIATDRIRRTLLELYPDMREVLLIRDFRDMVCSIIDYNVKVGLEQWGRAEAADDEEWLAHLREEAATMLARWQQARGVAHLVRYEDLILQPDDTLNALFSYLGVAADPETIQKVRDDAQSVASPAQTRHKTSSSPEASVGRWKRDLSPEMRRACATAFDDILVEFGYETTDVDATAPLDAGSDRAPAAS